MRRFLPYVVLVHFGDCNRLGCPVSMVRQMNPVFLGFQCLRKVGMSSTDKTFTHKYRLYFPLLFRLLNLVI